MPTVGNAVLSVPKKQGNPKGNLPLMREVSPQVTEGEKSQSVKFGR